MAASSTGGLGEFEIIARFFAPLAQDVPGAFGLLDDAALVAPADGTGLVLTTDMLIEGVHFREEDRAVDIGWKALAVNVSDLVAKGAEPLVYLLALALPRARTTAWIEDFARGLGEAQQAFRCRLAGGDTTATSGPVAVSIAAVGTVPGGRMVPRAGAAAGDVVYVSGTIGDAALGLLLAHGDAPAREWQLDTAQADHLRRRYWRPQPRTGLASIVRRHAHAAMDISDGLAADFGKMCTASGTGGVIRARDVPLSPAVARAVALDRGALELALTGGDDYELLIAVPPDATGVFEAECRTTGVPVTPIGDIRPATAGVVVIGPDGEALTLSRLGYDHFADPRQRS